MNNLILVLVLVMVLAVVSGCTNTGKEPVIGTWEWSDGKGYTEQYTFYENQAFSAKALGSEFIGTWKRTSHDHYQISYWYVNATEPRETLTDTVLYDHETDDIYFPEHWRVRT